MQNETQKEMRKHADEQTKRTEKLNAAIIDGDAEKKKIDDEAAARKAEIDARIRAISHGE